MVFASELCVATLLCMLVALAEAAATIYSTIPRSKYGSMGSTVPWNTSLAPSAQTLESTGLNTAMCEVLGEYRMSTACSCTDLYGARATTYVTTQPGVLTETGQYAYAEFHSTRPTTFSFTNTFTTIVMTEEGYRPPDNCCLDWCQVDADEVRILYWPVETNGTDGAKDGAASNASVTAGPALAVLDGMTFTSPSVYVAYTNINAHKLCGDFGSVFLGGNYNTTIAYPPTYLSTSKGATPNELAGQRRPNQYTAINYTDFQAYSLKPKPIFSLPRELSAIDPKWAGCFPAAYGAFDPPMTLEKATAMVPSSVAAAATKKGAAVPVGKAEAETAAPTPTQTPGPKDMQGSDPSASSGPQNQGALSEGPDTPGDPQADAPGTSNGDPRVINSGSGTSGDPGSGNINSNGASSSGFSSGGTFGNSDLDPGSSSNGGGVGNGDSPGLGSDASGRQGPSNQEDPSGGSPGDSDSSSSSNSNNHDLNAYAPGIANSVSPNQNAGSQGDPNPGAQSNGSPKSPTPNFADPGSSGQSDSNPNTKPGTDPVPNSNPNAPSNPPLNSPIGNQHNQNDHIANGNFPSHDHPSIGGQPINLAPNGGVVIGGNTPTTIIPGSSATVAGQVIAAGASFAVVDGSTFTPPPMAPTPVSVAGQPVRLAPDGNEGVVVGDTTITPGSSATIAGKVVAAGASFAIIDGSTITPPLATSPIPTLTPLPVSIAGQLLHIAPNGGIVISGPTPTTILPGSIATIAGEIISAGADFAIVGGSTVVYSATGRGNATASATGTAGLGGVIMGGLGYGDGGGEGGGGEGGEVGGTRGGVGGSDVTSAAAGRVTCSFILAITVVIWLTLSFNTDML